MTIAASRAPRTRLAYVRSASKTFNPVPLGFLRNHRRRTRDLRALTPQTHFQNGAVVPFGKTVGAAGSSTNPSVWSKPAKSPDVLLGTGYAARSAPWSKRTGRK